MTKDSSTNKVEVQGSVKGIVGSINGGTVTQYISNQPEDRIKERDLIKESPYKGLDKFEAEDKDKFFGREQLINSLSEYLEQNNLLLFVGASGSGKSSLVRAGLIPEFLDKKFVNLTFEPDVDPFERLYNCLIPKYGIAKAKIAQKGEADTLIQVVRELKNDSRWLIFIDQFEELFTRTDKEKRDKFINSLVQLITETQKENSVKIVLTMRADFLDEFDPYPSLGKIYDHYSRMLTAMSSSDLRLAIAEPAARNGVVFQAGLIEQIIDDFQGQTGSLPLLQYTLNLLWEKDEISDRILNKQTYYNLGRVTGALQQQANKVYDELLPAEKKAARQIFIDLIDVVGGKPVSRRADKANFNGDVLESTLNKLISNRLLVVSKQGEQKPTVAVAHEALLTSWEELQNWITEAEVTIVLKNRLIDDARHWSDLRVKQPQKADGELWGGSKLERVMELREQPSFSNLSAEANQFIDASVTERDRLRREEEEQKQRELEQEKARQVAQRRNRVATMSLVVLTGLTSFAFYQWNDAQKSTINALAQTSEASLLSNRQLEAMVTAVQAGRQVKNAILKDATASQTVNVALQRGLYNLQERNRLEGHSSWVNSVVFSPDGQTIASGSEDNTVKLWDVATGREIKTFNGHSAWVRSVVFSPDGKTIASGSGDNTVKLWDVETGRELKTFNGHTSWVWSVGFSPDGKTIASGSGDNTVKVWDVATGRELKTFNGHTSWVRSVGFSPDGKTIASGSADNTVKLWDVATGREIKTFNGHSAEVSSVVFSPKGQTIASGSSDNTVKLWDVATGREIKTFNGHSAEVSSVIFSRNGTTIASGSVDKTVKVWDVETDREIATFYGHSNGVSSVGFSPDGKTIASGSADKTVKLWDVAIDKPITTFNGHSDEVSSVGFSPDGKTIASGSADKTVKVWDVATGREIATFNGHSAEVRSVGFSPDGKTIASGSGDKTVKLWDVATGREIATFNGHSAEVNSVGFSPDGKTIASGSGDNTVKLWDVATGREIKTFNGHSAEVNSVGFSPDGQTIASGSGDKTVKLWDVATGREIKTFNGHSRVVNSVGFSPDGQTIASGSGDNTIKLWDVATGREPKTFEGHSDEVSSVGFSPKDQTIASGSGDNTFKLWDVATGREIKTFEGHSNVVNSVVFNPDSKTIASGSGDNNVKLWDVYPNELNDSMNRSCDRLRAYLQTNPKSDRHLCDGIGTHTVSP